MEDKIMKQKTQDIKKEFYIDSFKNKTTKTISSIVYITIIFLVIFIVFISEDKIPNKNNIIQVAIVIVFMLWTIFERAFESNAFEQTQKKKKSFEEKLQDQEKKLTELKFIHDSIIKKQQEKPVEGFEALLEKYKDNIESLEENIVWIKTNLELMGY